MQHIFEEQPLASSTHTLGIPAWLDGVVLKALAKRPEARYADAGAMGTALRQARQSPPRPRPNQPLPRWFWPVAGVAGVLVVVLVITIGALLGGGGDQETDVAAVTTTPALTTTPKGSDTPRPTSTATDTPKTAGTSTPRRTSTPLAPTATPQAVITQVWE